VKPRFAELGVGGIGDHRAELEREAQHLRALRFPAAQPTVHGARFGDTGDHGDGGGIEQLEQPPDDLADRQRHRLQMGVAGT
jgi:hypothetical protein